MAVLAVAAGCGGPAAPAAPDAGSDAGAGCPSSCDDGVYCNGVEGCDANGACTPGTAPCPAPMVCDEAMDRCRSDCPDADEDGAADAACGGIDCDDTAAAIHPGATEVCDISGVDEDCDPNTRGTRDGDGDGYIDAACCNGSACADDCDDGHRFVNPGSTEVCDGFDGDCDTVIDEGVQIPFFPDCDGDHDGAETALSMPVLGCGMPTSAPTGCMPTETRAGWSAYATDCDDHDGLRSSAQPEVPGDLHDNNCNGLVDEQFTISGSLHVLGGAVSGPTIRILHPSLEAAPEVCGATYCISGGFGP